MIQTERGNLVMDNEKKKGSCFLTGLGMIVFGLLFGVMAGVAYTGVRLTADKLIVPAAEALVAQNDTTPEATIKPGPTEAQLDLVNELNNKPDNEASEEVEDMLDDKEDGYTVTDIVDMCMPSIVSFRVIGDYTYYGVTAEGESAGSGIIIGQSDKELLIATNYHVIENSKTITIQFCDGTEAEADVKGKKVSMDLAVVSVNLESVSKETLDAIVVATIGDSDNLKVGEGVVAIGNALGYGQSVTTGVVSALNREIITGAGEKAALIQTDAAINPGNSGGALLNMNGELIGINSNKMEGSTVEGMGYAIPINEADPIIRDLMNKQELVELPEDEQSSIGITGRDVTSSMTTNGGFNVPVGIYIQDVMAGGAAEAAGLKRGDIITEFEGDSVVSMKELKQYLASYKSGSEVSITYKRFDGNEYIEYQTKVTLQSKAAISQ